MTVHTAGTATIRKCLRQRWLRWRSRLRDQLGFIVLAGVALGFAAIALLSGAALFLGFGIAALDTVMPRWLALLATAVVVLLTGVVAGGIGIVALVRARRTLPGSAARRARRRGSG